MKTIQSFFRSASCFGSDTRGVTAAVVALSMATLVGFAGLGIETGLWFSEKRGYQTAADAGALAGAWQMAHQLTAGGTAELNTGTTNLADNTPPVAVPSSLANGAVSSSYVTATQLSGPTAAQVVVTVPKSSLLASSFLPSLNISARAVATVNSSQACDLALYRGSSNPGVVLSGSGTLDLAGCKLMSDASGCDTSSGGGSNNSSVVIQDTGFHLSGATNIDAAGCIHTGGSFSCGTTGAICDNGAPPIADPLANTFKNFAMPSSASCSSATTFQSGVFHYGKIKVTSGSVDLAPGTYYIDSGCGGGADGSLNTGNVSVGCSTCSLSLVNGVLTGSGVTLIANGPISMNSVNGLNAPGASSGQPYPGVLIYQPPPSGWSSPTTGNWNNCSSFPGICDSISGNANQLLQGAVYLPAGWLTFTGDESTGGCFLLISYLLQITGNGTNGMNVSQCPGFVATPTQYTAVLTQ